MATDNNVVVPDTIEHSEHDDGYETASTTSSASYATSISSYIREGIEENGRKYASYGKHAYGMPIDEREQDRNDLQHVKFNLSIGDKLHSAPLSDTPSKILDLGTGSGIWAIDMADKYETAHVTGVDIAPVQPAWVPPNCQFEVLDIEEDNWLLKKNSFDFVHARELLLSIRDWPRLFRQAYEHARPGGWFEVSSTYPSPTCDDGTLADDASLLEVKRMFWEMGEKMGTSVEAPKLFKQQLIEAGFVDVVENVIKVPQGPWPKDKRLKKIGAFENYSLSMGLEAYLMRGYTSVMGGDPNQLQLIVAQTRKELADPTLHSYVWYYNVYGRRPGDSSGHDADAETG